MSSCGVHQTRQIGIDIPVPHAQTVVSSLIPTATATPTFSPTPAPTPSPTPTATAAINQVDVVSGELDTAIRAALGPQIDDYSVVVHRLSDGASADINGSRVYYAASLFKLAVLYEVERQVSAGLVDPNGSMTLTQDDVSQDLGTLQILGLGVGDSLPVQTALRAMVTYSDNTSAIALLHLVGGANVDAMLRNLGIDHTDVDIPSLPTTADDMAALMTVVYEGRGVSSSAADQMRQLLEAQEVRSGIPAGLPSGIVVGNKTGNWTDATHDVAFVQAPGGTYIIAVLSDQAYVWGPTAAVSRAVYRVLSDAS